MPYKLDKVLAAGVLEQSGVKRVVDLGCGEGKLLEHLIRSQDCPSLQQMVCLSYPWQYL